MISFFGGLSQITCSGVFLSYLNELNIRITLERAKMATELSEKSVHYLRNRAKVSWSFNGRVIEGLQILECFICFVIIDDVYFHIKKLITSFLNLEKKF